MRRKLKHSYKAAIIVISFISIQIIIIKRRRWHLFKHFSQSFPFLRISEGNRFWVFKDTTLQPTYPQDISLFGNGMPTQSIETAVWWEDVAKTYFFKGDRSVLQLPGTVYNRTQWTPPSLDCSTTFETDFSFSVYYQRYWRYNEDMRTMDPGYPKPITVWKGIPDSPQGAFVDKANGKTLK